METNYDQDLYIDIDQLEIEWLRQPHLYMKYSNLAADAGKEVDIAKQNLDVKRAVTDDIIRDLLKERGEKITEKIVESSVMTHETYMKALEKYNKRKHEYTILQAGVRAMEQRKSALENLVKLALGGYFSMPIEPKSIENIREKALDTLDKQVRDKINLKYTNRSKVNGEKRPRQRQK